MGRPEITRRDFLNGTRVALTGALLSPWTEAFGAPAPAFAPERAPDYYPPAKTGMRGSHDGSWEVAHARVAGQRWKARASGERYDLVVVGGGISGLAAAHFYRRARPDARILVLENHDDFGGHAKRNEFRAGGARRIGYGGSESLEAPWAYSGTAKGLLRELGVEIEKFHEAFDRGFYAGLGLTVGLFFDAETFGADRLVPGFESLPWPEFAARTPLGERARADLVRLNTERKDYLPGLSPAQKRAFLRKISHEDFLRRHVAVDPAVLDVYRRMWLDYYALGLDSTPASWIAEEPLVPGLAGTVGEHGRPFADYIYHFPDGNASIARLLVRSLIPAALPGETMEDVVTARADYARLDAGGSPVRVRLNSTAVEVRHAADGASVEVIYVRGGEAHAVRGRHCVLACYNGAIPYLFPELPEAQKRALAYGVKAPMVYVTALLRSWRAFVQRGIHEIMAPGSFYTLVSLDFPVSLGSYRHVTSPDEPIVLHLVYVPYHPEQPGVEQWRAGRRELLTAPFARFEAELREQLGRMLGSDFDAQAQVLAITVNRWPHGYAYTPNPLWDPEWKSHAEEPWVIGRQRRGRVAIANSDAGASAYLDAAIDQARRAVGELLA